MSIFIVRHGQTHDNANRILQKPDSPLSAIGHKQAKLLARRLLPENITHIISSDYIRAKQTAEYISEVIEITPEYNPLLRERNFGHLRGIAYDDLDSDPFATDVNPPGGESWAAFYLRVDNVWKNIVNRVNNSKNNLVIVTHGLVCDALVKNHLSLPKNRVNASNITNTALTKVSNRPPWIIEIHNCTLHLGEKENSPPSSRA